MFDLSQYDFNKDGPIKLDGEWALYKNQLLTYKDFEENKQKQGQLQKVPGSFTIDQNKKGEKGFGYGTYRLRVKTNARGMKLGFKLLTMSTSYSIMIDDTVIATNGQVATSKAAYIGEYKPQTVLFEPKNNTFDIIVQVANYTYNRIGIWHSLIIGEYEQVVHLRETSFRRTMFLLGGIVFMLFYQIGIYYLHRHSKRAHILLIVSLIIMTIRLICTGEYYIVHIITGIKFPMIIWLEYLTIMWGPVVITLFNYELFPKEISRRGIRLLVVLAIFNTITITFLPIHIYTSLLVFYEALYISTFIYLMIRNIKSIQKGRNFACLCVIGHGFVIFTSVVDILYFKQVIRVMDGGMTPFSVFIIIVLHMFIIAKQHEESYKEVNRLSKNLIKQDKIKDEFLANTSHEIRTPLHGMISLMEHLEHTGDNLKHQQKENITYAIQSGRRLASLVNDILDYAKLKNDDLKIHLKDVSLASAAQYIIDTQKYLIANDDVNLYQEIDPSIKVHVDENRFIQILMNLISNAIKFTTSGYIQVHGKVVDEYVEICVEDTGTGIPSNKLQNIFEAYQQFEENHTSLGTGLGLNIAKNLVELHGGKIWAESIIGKGSKFYFTVLRGKSPGYGPYGPYEVQDEDIDQRIMHSGYFNKMKIYQKDKKDAILIVDDDFTNLYSLTHILSVANYKLFVTSNCQEAIYVIDHYNIDMAILDMMMDDMTGLELCQYIREKYTLFQLPVLLLTAQVNRDALIYGFKAGTNDFLTKPFSGEELRARVRTLIKMKKSAEEAITNEVAFLQAQIKPHFIYNAINTMVSLCDTDPCRAGDLLVDFSLYLRKSFDFNNTKQWVTLDSELDYVQAYLKIEQARFEDKIYCNYHIEKEHMGLMIPPLILQPLVENAVKHGITKKSGKGQINIRTEHEADYTILSVEDDGIGMDKESINRVILLHETGKSVGLRNIHKRLMHYYGLGLHIESEPGKGCKVTIKIPDPYMKEGIV
ncbi:response regulator [Vallitalea pronyensis]|uniref:Stage 0 sporulation protein A homolog n=1 Tax=Vallitalea pronyensis TaxID=1348613 RepID=A0A8J8MI78_9FIRM|nr:ATP-binding protein [Vallitalea pronyensis]QUI21768.1 response regulator [Vallitalea pronyensis]